MKNNIDLVQNEQISISIECNNSEFKKLSFYPNSNPENTAFQFCKDNNLDYDSLIILANKIKEYQNQYKEKNTIKKPNEPEQKEIIKDSNNIDILQSIDQDLVPTYINNNNTKSKSCQKGKEKNPKFSQINELNQIYKQINKKIPKPSIPINKNKNNIVQNPKESNIKKGYTYRTKTTSKTVRTTSSVNTNKQSLKTNYKTPFLNNEDDVDNSNDPYLPYENIHTENISVNKGERLYRKEMKLQEESKKKLDVIRKKSHDKQKYTFTPKINVASIDLCNYRDANHKAYNDEYNILNFKLVKDLKIENTKSKLNLNEEKYTFKPEIDKNSSKIDGEMKYNGNKRYIKLYNDTKKIENDLEVLTNEIYDKTKLFKPTINNDYYSNNIDTLNSMNFNEKMDYYNSKSIEKRRLLTERVITEETKKNNYYKPCINTKNRKVTLDLNNENNNDIFDNLYNKANFYKKKKEDLCNMVYENEQKMIKNFTNENSEEIFNKKKMNNYKKIFEILDRKKRGFLTKKNIYIEGLSKKLQKIIEPIANELKEENLNLNYEEFIAVLDQLYECSDYNERKILIGNEIINENINNNKNGKGKINVNVNVNNKVNSKAIVKKPGYTFQKNDTKINNKNNDNKLGKK